MEAGVIGRQDLAPPPLPAHLRHAIDRLRAELAGRPFEAPSARRLAELGLAGRNLVAAERAGAVLVVTDGVVLLPDAADRAAERLRSLPAPFTVSQARVRVADHAPGGGAVAGDARRPGPHHTARRRITNLHRCQLTGSKNT